VTVLDAPPSAVQPVTVIAGCALHYDCDRGGLPDGLAQRFVALECDDDARRFLARVVGAPHGRIRTAAYGLLRRFLSDYDAYGLLDMYTMHLLSTAQLRLLLGDAVSDTGKARRLLDVGAGNGDITACAAEFFDDVTVTEASAVMQRRLRARGFRVLDHDLASDKLPSCERFDAAICLNVVDRCTHPRTLLRHLCAALAEGAPLLLSVPLPLSAHVQRASGTSDPDEPLPPPRETWEAGAGSFADELLTPAGLRVERLSRAPYLCRGDATKPLYVLDAALFVCTRIR
jgi:SAM-dependent methyltransferase